MKKLQKVERNNQIAVLYSPGYGAGWYSWNQDYPQLLFHPKLIELIEKGERDIITEEFLKVQKIISKKDYVYCGGVRDLEIQWLEKGTLFEIEEFDGNEQIKTLENLTLQA